KIVKARATRTSGTTARSHVTAARLRCSYDASPIASTMILLSRFHSSRFMKLIDPHIHCISRTTDDYLYMARAGVVAVSEPAFWAGFDRSSVSSFADYFRQLTDVEPQRAAKFGIEHFCWLCINAKEAENVELSREVIKLIPPLLGHPRVLGVGEIGLNK